MNLVERLDLKIQEGQVLQSRLDTFKIIPGVEKLSRKIRKELQFLQPSLQSTLGKENID